MTVENKEERRRFHRILFDAPTTLSYAEGVQSSNLIDISLSGALVVTPKEWSGVIGDEIMLKVLLGDEEPHISMQTKISHQESGQIGLRCLHIDIESIGHLRRLVELNLGDTELLERELEALG